VTISIWRALGLLPMLAVLAGCGGAPPRSSLSGWIIEESYDVGPCRFRRGELWLYHTSEFNLRIQLAIDNIGSEPAHCAFDMQAVNAAGKAVTDAASGAVDLAPQEGLDLTASATEANLTGISSGGADDAWIYVKLTHGYPVIGETRELHATPSRDLPDL
jgi:hypothetical protein